MLSKDDMKKTYKKKLNKSLIKYILLWEKVGIRLNLKNPKINLNILSSWIGYVSTTIIFYMII